jgi:HSP20 family protein
MAVTYDPVRELDRFASALFGSGQGPRRMPIDLYRDGDHSRTPCFF